MGFDWLVGGCEAVGGRADGRERLPEMCLTKFFLTVAILVPLLLMAHWGAIFCCSPLMMIRDSVPPLNTAFLLFTQFDVTVEEYYQTRLIVAVLPYILFFAQRWRLIGAV